MDGVRRWDPRHCRAPVIGLLCFCSLAATTQSPTSKPTTKPTHVDDRVAFVLSTGGSMLNVFGDAKLCVKAGVEALTDKQRAQLFAAGDGKVQTPAKALWLVPATDSWKDEADRFLDNSIATGGSSISVGLQAALKTHPDVIWVVANGAGVEEPSVALALCHRFNAGRHSRINTLTRFASDDPHEQQFLYDLATQNGGVCLGKDGKPLTSPPVPPPDPKVPPKRPKPSVPNPFVEP